MRRGAFVFFCAAREAGTHFLVRTCVDRLASDGRRTVTRVMARVPIAGQHGVEITAEDGSATQAVLKLRYKRVHILPPVGKQTLIDHAVRDRPTIPLGKTLSHYLLKIACLGGYLARARDRPPCNIVMWRGWSRPMDIMLGADLMQPKCG